MKSYQERTESIAVKAKKIRRRRKLTVVASCACVLALLVGMMFVPFGGDKPTDLSLYEGQTYYALIKMIDKYNSQYLSLSTSVWDQMPNIIGSVVDEATPPLDDSPSETFEETTLNQVEGVAEGDIVKRTQTHAFYLGRDWDETARNYVLTAYSLCGSNSARVGDVVVAEKDGVEFSTYFDECEMFVSDDGRTATLLLPCLYYENWYTCIVRLDISNPTDIVETGREYFSGSYLSARRVGGKLLLFTQFCVPSKVNYDKLQTYVPSYGAAGEWNFLPLSDIALPEYVESCSYTVVYALSESNLEVLSHKAFLSTCGEVYVSQEHIFVVGSAGVKVVAEESVEAQHCTKIFALSYQDRLENLGEVVVGGAVNSRYWLHEKDGKLFVVATCASGSGIWWLSWNDDVKVENADGKVVDYSDLHFAEETTSASLYCFDLTNFEEISRVLNFAPKGEDVKAVRFDGDQAFVCTAIRQTDPVFVFDITNPLNIAQKDTGKIPGYSVNLLTFGEYLLGIGYGDERTTLKIEVYSHSGDSVVSVATNCQELTIFSENYKAHFVDGERQLVGLLVQPIGSGPACKYLLLHFDGENLQETLLECGESQTDSTRAFYLDGLYVVSQDGIFFFEV